MKNILFLFLSLFLVLSCDEKGEKFSGSPVGKANFVNIEGTVATQETIVSTVQDFKFTATIPQTFASDVEVEATIVGANTSIRRAKIIIPAGQTSAIGSITAPVAIDSNSSTLTFTQTATLYLSAIIPSTLVPNTNYTISSNKLVLNLSDTTVPISNSDRCIIRFDWIGPWGELGNPLKNDLDMRVKKDGVLYTTLNPAPLPGNPTNQNTIGVGKRYENFSIMNTYPDGDFTFETFAKSLIASGDLKCRFVVVNPKNISKTIEYVEPALLTTSLPSTPITRLKIRKLTTAGVVDYSIIP